VELARIPVVRLRSPAAIEQWLASASSRDGSRAATPTRL
jgi:hypothetical protein